MDMMQTMRDRHSVRSYLIRPIEGTKAALLYKAVQEANTESGLHIQLMLNEPGAFSGRLARYGSFHNCTNYFAIVAKDNMDESIGYYGERLVLLAQQLGLNTCWVAMTYSRRKVPVKCGAGEKLRIVIALGYGETQGVPHRMNRDRVITDMFRTEGEIPEWFRLGMEAAILAPTALNQQKFRFYRKGNSVRAKALPGPYTKIDLGIVKYHFELGAGKEHFNWV